MQTLIVSWDFSNGSDEDILLVAKDNFGLVKVLNAFTGKEAHEILEKLVGQEEI